MRRILVLLAACALTLGSVCGTRTATEEPSPTESETATPTPTVVDDTSPITVWVPHSESLHPHDADRQLTAALFSPLVVNSADRGLPAWGPQAPGALMDSLSSDDLQRWDLTIKQGWRWHDGTEVTSEDLARGWNASIAADLPVVSTITDVRVRDKYTLSFALAAPYGQFPALLGSEAFLPLPLLADTSPGRFATTPIGQGPYRIAGRQSGGLELEAVAGHPGGPAATPLIWLDTGIRPESGTDVVVAADGEVLIPGEDGAQDEPRVQVQRVPGRQLAYLGLPLTDPRFADPDVRRALSLALDREALAAEVLSGGVVPADRLLGPGMSRSEGVRCVDCQFDAGMAAQLWPEDFAEPLTIWFASDGGHGPVVDAIAASWHDVLGVGNLQLASLPADDLITRLADNEVSGPFRLSWAADSLSPSRVLEPLFGPGGTANDGRYRNQEVDDLLNAAGLERDLPAALDRYGAVEQRILQDLPIIPLWFSTIGIAATADVTLAFDGQGHLDWRSIRQP